MQVAQGVIQPDKRSCRVVTTFCVSGATAAGATGAAAAAAALQAPAEVDIDAREGSRIADVLLSALSEVEREQETPPVPPPLG